MDSSIFLNQKKSLPGPQTLSPLSAEAFSDSATPALSFSQGHCDLKKSSLIELPPLKVSPEDYVEMAVDSYFRTMPNTKLASFALIVGDEAHFYTPPVTEEFEPTTLNGSDKPLTDFQKYFTRVPGYQALVSVEEHSAFPGHLGYIGKTATGETLYGKHKIDLTLEDPAFSAGPLQAKLVSFYPDKGTHIYWGSCRKIESLFDFSREQKSCAESESLESESQSCKRKISSESSGENTAKKLKLEKKVLREGFKFLAIEHLPLDLKSVLDRKEIKTRKPSQNQVMKRSSVEEMARFLKTPLSNYLNPYIREFLGKCAKAPYPGQKRNGEKVKNVMWDGQWRSEWLHLVGFGCTPIWLQPQIPENLGSAPKCVNTEQMMTEYFIQGLAKKAHSLGYTKNDIAISIEKSFFELIPTTNIISYMSFNTRVQLRERVIHTHQNFSPLQPLLFRRKSDVAFLGVVGTKFLEGDKPDHTVKITPLSSQSKP